MAELEVAGKKDAHEAGRHLSDSSRKEIFASGGWTDGPRYVRAMQNRSIECFMLNSPRGRAMAVWGLHPRLSGWVFPWLVTTPEAAKYPILFLRMARAVLDTYRSAHPRMLMHVHALDAKGLKLAAALGLRPGEPVRRGSGLFCEIKIITKKIEVA